MVQLAPHLVGGRDDPVRPDARAVLGVLVVVISWLSGLTGIAMGVAFELPLMGSGIFTPLYLVNALVYAPVSALLIARRVQPVGLVLAVLAIGSGLSAIGAQYGALSVLDPGVPGAGVAQHVFDRLWLPGTLAAFSFVPLLLTDRPLRAWTRVLVGVGAVSSALPLLLTVVRQRPGAETNPFAIPSEVAQLVFVWLFYSCLAVVALVAVISGVVLFWRWRFGPEDDRRGVGWLLVGQWLLILFFSPLLFAWFPAPADFLGDTAPLALPLAQLFMPAAVLVAALGPRMRGIDITLNRAVMWVLLIASLLVAYGLIASLLSVLFPVPAPVAGVVAVAVLALGIEPLRRWLQRRVDALFYGEAADPVTLMRSLGSNLPGSTGNDDLGALVDALLVTLRLGSVSVRSVRSDGVTASAGETVANAASVDIQLFNRNERIGTVTATAAGGQRLHARTVEALENIAGVLAIALQLSDVNREAREARERVLDVREEERRMVRRELHDGLAPALAVAASEAEGVASAFATDPTAARARLAGLRTDIAALTNEVRDLARTLLPNALDNGDLDAALRELADRFGTGGLHIRLELRGSGELDATRQAAVYHIVAEAVLLVRRTRGVRLLTVSVDRTVARGCVIRIDQDDAPLPPGADTVLASVRERADELGGSMEQGAQAGLHLTIRVPT